MSLKESFALVVGGLLALYGVLVWRIAWTVVFVAVTLLIVSVYLFNRPRAIIPPYARDRR